MTNFANAAYCEDTVQELLADHPKARFFLSVGDGINQFEASGEEAIHHRESSMNCG
jgi:SulP family sulfate permease